MPDDLNARRDRIEKELKDLSKKVEAINEHIEGLSTDLLGADQVSGTSRKLDEILERLREDQQ